MPNGKTLKMPISAVSSTSQKLIYRDSFSVFSGKLWCNGIAKNLKITQFVKVAVESMCHSRKTSQEKMHKVKGAPKNHCFILVGSIPLPGWWLREPPPASGVVLYLADERCGQTEKKPTYNGNLSCDTPRRGRNSRHVASRHRVDSQRLRQRRNRRHRRRCCPHRSAMATQSQ